MPVTKQKLIRHYALDRCLRNQTRRYYIEDLLMECKALEANSSVATDESQSTIMIVELQNVKNQIDISQHRYSIMPSFKTIQTGLEN